MTHGSLAIAFSVRPGRPIELKRNETEVISFLFKVLTTLPIHRFVPTLILTAICSVHLSFAGEFAQKGGFQHSVVNFSIPAGLPSDVASEVLQTSDGYLWVGTEAGLVRYDGVQFVTFRTANTPGLRGNVIRALHEDSEGTLWIGTNNGLTRHRNNRFEGMPQFDASVSDITETRNGSVWISTNGEGLWEVTGDGLTSHVDDWLIPAVRVTRRVFADSSGRMWLGFPVGGIAFIEGGEFKLHPAAGMKFPLVESFFEDSDGSVWVGTAEGAYRFDRESATRVDFHKRGGSQPTHGFMRDSTGHMWVLSDTPYRSIENGDTTSFTEISIEGIESSASIIQDREGSFWIGTVGGGVVRVRRSAFGILSSEDGSWPKEIQTVSIDAEGSIWAGTGQGTIAKMAPGNPSRWIETVIDEGIEIWSVCPASNGDVWIGTDGPLLRLRDGVVEQVTSLGNVRVIHEDFEGNIWFGPEEAGVYVLRGAQLVSLAGAIAGSKSTVSAFADGPDQSLYIGFRSGEGLIRVKQGNAVAVSAKDGTRPDDIGALYVDASENVWVGTKHDGLVLVKDGRWHKAASLGESFTESISVIAEDDIGNLWIGTPRGISWGNKSEILKLAQGTSAEGVGPFRFVRPGDGVARAEIGSGNHPVAVKDRDGRLLFATKAGILSVQPEQIEINPVAPSVQIERVVADNVELPLAKDVRIPAGTRTLEIKYTGVGFVRPDRFLFRYRLAGFDTEWIEANTRRVAYYTNLPPGKYRFEVQSANDDGVWTETGGTVELNHPPRFHQTGWFYALVAAGVVVLIAMLIRRRTAKLRSDKRMLEEHVEVRTRELRAAQQETEDAMRIKTNFLNTMSHELRTPLNGVLGMCDLLLDTPLDDEQREMGQTVVDSANSLLSIVSDILEYSQNAADTPKLASEPFDPRSMAEDVVQSVFPDAGKKHLELYFEDEDEIPPVVVGDSRRIRQVLTNLVNNAIKFTHDGEVVVKLGFQQGNDGPPFLRFEIRDTGIGMDDEGKRRIFQTFSQVDGSLTRKYGGTGIGLAISKQLVGMMGGRIGVESLPDRGSMFWFTVRAELDASLEIPASSPPALSDARVVVASGSPTFTSIVGRSLRRWGAVVEPVSNREELLESLKKHAPGRRIPECIIIDLARDGFAIAAQCRELASSRELTLIVVGSERSADDRRLGDDHQVVFLEKPLRITVLRQVLATRDRLFATSIRPTERSFL